MKRRRFILAAFFFVSLSLLHAQGIIGSAQQTLKDKGFYYGEITGRKDAGTIAAIRRYQIRNGLAINGELDADTQRSLGLISGPVAQATATSSPSNNTADSGDRSKQTGDEPVSPSTAPVEPNSPERVPASEPRVVQPEITGIFDGTPYESAPGLWQQTIMEAQEVLAHGGYYRAAIDGAYGPGTEFALRAFQAQKGLPVTGRLDKPTLAALGLLPGQRPQTLRRRLPRRPFSRPVYRGEWIPE